MTINFSNIMQINYLSELIVKIVNHTTLFTPLNKKLIFRKWYQSESNSKVIEISKNTYVIREEFLNTDYLQKNLSRKCQL